MARSVKTVAPDRATNAAMIKHYLNRRILLEMFPALVFFVVNYGWGIMPATAAVIAATIVAVGAGLSIEKRVPVFAVVTVVLVLLLGGASLVLHDETFIKMKPTVAKLLFASALGLGLLFKPSFLARALQDQVHLSPNGWRVLTGCWVAFALGLAALNEVMWRLMDTDTWVTFKTILTPASIIGYITITRLVAPFYWQIPAENSAENKEG